jgi:hypothetical protein
MKKLCYSSIIQTVMKTKYSTHYGHDKDVYLSPELDSHL